MLEATEITKYYGMRLVLRKVTLLAAKGEFIVLLGPNGAGKTTLLRVLATLARPEGGTLVINGVDALAHPAGARSQIGLVSHQTLVYADLTALENLQFYARMYGVPVTIPNGLSAQGSPVIEALRQVDLLKRAHDPVRTFSRGMLQRLSIARAMLHNPPLLLLDEPYTGLDQASARSLSTLLRELAFTNRAVVMTTHEYTRGLDGATRAVVIKSGRIVEELANDITPDRVQSLMNQIDANPG